VVEKDLTAAAVGAVTVEKSSPIETQAKYGI
jgi:hypothetical protein